MCEIQTCAKSFSYVYLTYYTPDMERQVTLKSIIIPSSSDLIAPLVICSLISHEVFADSPSFSFKWYLIPKQLVFYEYAKRYTLQRC